ncbi:LysM peptidoglycan-binding domain-containing protein [Streptococcus sp. FT1-106]|uniref:LysM peptidoglycan-binding domain-containing protein n=1 Tax=unclassified Streptococcus TaxID=2608887 RepID=UPI003BF57F77
MSKIITKKSLLFSTVALSMFAANHVHGDEVNTWTARSVEEIKAGLVVEENKTIYKVQYGDTLSAVAEAMGIDINVLANLNKITNLDLIFPETILTMTYNDANQVSSVAVETPAVNQPEKAITATADLENNQVVVGDQVVDVADLTQNIINTQESNLKIYAQTTEPVKDAIAQITETQPSISTEESSEEASQITDPAENSEVLTTEEVKIEEATSQTVEATQSSTEETNTTEQVSASETAPTAVQEVTQNIIEDTAAQSEQPVAETVVDTNQVTETPVTTQEQGIQATAVAQESAESIVETIAQTPEESETTTVTPVSTQATTYDNTGLQPQTAAFKEEVAGVYGITDFSGYRPGDPEDHGKGLAIDFMVYDNSSLGDQVAQYAVDNIADNGISYIIWQQKFYSPWDNIYGPANTWNQMPDRGSDTANHMDHVHVSFTE